MRKSRLEHMLRIYAGYELPAEQAGPVELDSFPTSEPLDGMESPGFIDLDDDTQIEATEKITEPFLPGGKSWRQNPISTKLDTFNTLADDEEDWDEDDESISSIDHDSDEPVDERTVLAAFRNILRKSAGKNDPWHYPHRTAQEYNKGDLAKLKREIDALVESIKRRIDESSRLTGRLFGQKEINDIANDFIAKKWWPKDLPGFENSGRVVKKVLSLGTVPMGRATEPFLREQESAYDDLIFLFDEIHHMLPDEKLNLGDYKYKPEPIDPNKKWDL